MLIAIIAIAIVPVLAPVYAQGTAPYQLRESAPATGTSLKRSIATGGLIPFDKEWHELTAEQQQAVRDEYDNLAPTDEPPFPLGGLRTIVGPIATGYRRAAADAGEGELMMVAHIAADGVPKKVDVYKAVPDQRFMVFSVGVAMKARFKPARCQGNPCAMPFALSMTFGRQ